ncbi:MAG TPA: hypothetical protein VIJ93_02270 [bacterium]
MRILFAFSFILLMASCASIGIRDQGLELQISPIPIERGKPALAKINAPLNAQKVVGTILVFGSPELQFRKNEKEGLWYFYGTIPFSPWVKPGTYQVRVVSYLPNEKPHYTEMKVNLK